MQDAILAIGKNMNPIQHPTNNRAIGAPKDWGVTDKDDPNYCVVLPITDVSQDPFGNWMVSFWKPDKAELDRLKAGKPVMLWIQGVSHPVVSVSVEV